MSQHSAACCSIPPVVSEGYEPKGEYITVDGLKTYVTGPKDAKKAILVTFDIFGFYPQTLQGADILAESDKDAKYRVYIPDWFEGSPADISWYPPDTKEKGEKLGNFFSTTGAPPKTVQRIPKVLEELKKLTPSADAWGLLGFCWGGKVTSLSSTAGTPFKAAAIAHPAMVDPNDAPKITIPFTLLASKDEDPKAVAEFKDNLKVKNYVETYPDQIHGWMAARSNLKDAKVKAEYERGYKTVLTFFHENL